MEEPRALQHACPRSHRWPALSSLPRRCLRSPPRMAQRPGDMMRNILYSATRLVNNFYADGSPKKPVLDAASPEASEPKPTNDIVWLIENAEVPEQLRDEVGRSIAAAGYEESSDVEHLITTLSPAYVAAALKLPLIAVTKLSRYFDPG